MGDTYKEQERIWERMQEKKKAKRGLYSDASEEKVREKEGFGG